MRMAEAGRHLDLAKETLGTQASREIGMKDLQRHLAAVLLVMGQVDGGHSATAQLPLDDVPACHGFRGELARDFDASGFDQGGSPTRCTSDAKRGSPRSGFHLRSRLSQTTQWVRSRTARSSQANALSR